MRFTLSCLALIALTASCQKESQGEKEIEKAQGAIQMAIAGQDLENLSTLAANDAALINLTTQETIEGRDNIASFLKKQFEQTGKPTAIKTTIDEIDFPEDGKAVENGVMKLTFAPDNVLQIAYKAEFNKVNANWILQRWTQVDIVPPASHYEDLKDLNWLVGKWVNNADDLVYTSSYKWDKSKNFLIQRFTLKVLGHKQLTGKQIIGWDPTNKKIRSWVFDSEGGFGQSNWTKSGESWFQSQIFTLSDGERASATHIITKLDDKSYKFQSVGRDTNGQMMPNVGPFTVIRQG